MTSQQAPTAAMSTDSLTLVYVLQIENAMYPVNVEALNTVFSPYGFVQKIAIFEKNGQTQVIQFVHSTCTHAGAGTQELHGEIESRPSHSC